MICLVKPQFEAGKDKIGKKGVVRDPQVHTDVVNGIVGFAFENGFTIKNIDYSPIKGPEGNIEYLMHIVKCDEPQKLIEVTADELVAMSHSVLDK